jgi:hypothetical protein
MFDAPIDWYVHHYAQIVSFQRFLTSVEADLPQQTLKWIEGVVERALGPLRDEFKETLTVKRQTKEREVSWTTPKAYSYNDRNESERGVWFSIYVPSIPSWLNASETEDCVELGIWVIGGKGLTARTKTRLLAGKSKALLKGLPPRVSVIDQMEGDYWQIARRPLNDVLNVDGLVEPASAEGRLASIIEAFTRWGLPALRVI